MKYVYAEGISGSFSTETKEEMLEKLGKIYRTKFESIDDFNEWSDWAYDCVVHITEVEE
jgi:hypothetical protein